MEKSIEESLEFLLPILANIFEQYLISNFNKKDKLTDVLSFAMTIGTSFLFSVLSYTAKQDKELLKMTEKWQELITKTIEENTIFSIKKGK